MYDLFFVIRSVTYAQRGRDALSDARIRCSLGRSPRSISTSGCAYTVATSREDGPAASVVLKSAAIPYSGPYYRSNNGVYREISL